MADRTLQEENPLNLPDQTVMFAYDTAGGQAFNVKVLEELVRSGVQCHLFLSEDAVRLLKKTCTFLDAPNVVTHSAGVDVGELTSEHALFDKGPSKTEMLKAAIEFSDAVMKPELKRLFDLVISGEIDPKKAVIVANTSAMVYMAKMLMWLGFEKSVVIDPYLAQQLNKDAWPSERTQFFGRNFLTGPLMRLLYAKSGTKYAKELINSLPEGERGKLPSYSEAKKTLMKHQASGISPQLLNDVPKEDGRWYVTGYPYTLDADELGELPGYIGEFIDHQHSDNKKIGVVTIGSMQISAEAKRKMADTITNAARQAGYSLIILGVEGESTDDVLYSNEYTPYEVLFPAVDFLISHGGSGTAHLGLYAGVPIIGIPFLPDQTDWIDRMAELGMTPGYVTWDQFSEERIYELIDSLEPEMFIAAQHAGEVERREYSNAAEKLLEIVSAVWQET